MFKRPWKWIKTHKVFTLIGLVTLLVAGFFAYEKTALELNRRAFQSAQHTIDTVYTDIVSNVGQPDDDKMPSYCTRIHQEFTQGPISCDIDIDFVYSVESKADANNLLGKIQQTIGSNTGFKATRPLAKSIGDSLVVNTYYHAASDKYRVGDLDCVVNYIYDTPREIDLKIKNRAQKPFEITIGCYGLARQAYYPLSD